MAREIGKAGKSTSGRKNRSQEDLSRRVCQRAIIKKYGSMEEGAMDILNQPYDKGTERLKLFIFNHAFGNVPQTTIAKITTPDGETKEIEQVLVSVVRTSHNQGITQQDIENNEG